MSAYNHGPFYQTTESANAEARFPETFHIISSRDYGIIGS